MTTRSYNLLSLSFSRKYVIWLLVPPAVVIGPLSYVFLSQVVRMSLGAAEAIIGLFTVFFAINAAILWIGLTPLALKLGTGAEAYAPLARAIIGGLAVSVVLTVFIVPAAYYLAHRGAEQRHTA